MKKTIWHKLMPDNSGEDIACGIDVTSIHWVVDSRKVTCKNCLRKLGRKPKPEVVKKRSPKQSSYIDALVYRIVGELQRRGTLAWNTHGTTVAAESRAAEIVRRHVTDVLDEIQHRLYQHPIADLQDLARDLHPETERK